MGPIWQRHARPLLIEVQESLNGDTGVLPCRLQRRNASRNLLVAEDNYPVIAIDKSAEEKLLGLQSAFDWKFWYRETHVLLVKFCRDNTGFAHTMSASQELKTERSQLKEAVQNVKSSSHADKRTRRLHMNCVKWMNRTHRRQAAASNSIQAQTAAMSKAELTERLQNVESSIQEMAREQFGLRRRAMKSLHKLNMQLASGTKLLQDLGVCLC
ncbi:hypothetical protein DVH05_012883 [Phytophthora capsici]|nr:hypothetical protein DVH05_002325 [Phytophthora capsici]KAG1699470.1 hypothetical protein DVH05_012883 [Phytophthora capsici]